MSATTCRHRGRSRGMGIGRSIESQVRASSMRQRMQRSFGVVGAPVVSSEAVPPLSRRQGQGHGGGHGFPSKVQLVGQATRKRLEAAEVKILRVQSLVQKCATVETQRKKLHDSASKMRAALEKQREKATKAQQTPPRQPQKHSTTPAKPQRNDPATNTPVAGADSTPDVTSRRERSGGGAQTSPPSAPTAGGRSSGADADCSPERAADLLERFRPSPTSVVTMAGRKAAGVLLAQASHPRMLSFLTGSGNIKVLEPTDQGRPLPTPPGRSKETELFRFWPLCSSETDEFRQQLQLAMQSDADFGRIRSVAQVLLQGHQRKNAATLKGVLLALLPRNGCAAQGDNTNRVSAGDVFSMFRVLEQRLPAERKARVIDLIVDRSIFLQGTSTLPTEPWRIALQCMLVSCSQNPPLGTAYHVTRWHMKIEDTIARIAAKSSRKGFNFDPDDDQNPRDVIRELEIIGSYLQLHVWCTYQISRQWQYFKEVADKSQLKPGWDVLSAVDFTKVARHLIWSVMANLLNHIAKGAANSDEESRERKLGIAALEVLCALLRNNGIRVEPRSERDKRADGRISVEQTNSIKTLAPPDLMPHLLHEMYGPSIWRPIRNWIESWKPRLKLEAMNWDEHIEENLKAVISALEEAETQKKWRAL